MSDLTRIARELFEANAARDGFNGHVTRVMWATDPDLRAFWEGQVQFVKARLESVR